MPSVSVGGGQEATKRIPDKVAKYTIDLEEMNKAEKALDMIENIEKINHITDLFKLLIA